MTINPSIYGMTMEQWTAWFVDKGYTAFRASQVWEHIYRNRTTRFESMKELQPDCIELLTQQLSIETMAEHLKQQSADGTVKFLFKLHDGHLIETVLMRQKYGLAVCVTTQVGCNIGCSFCASGLLPKKRDLNTAEIVEQIIKVQMHLDQAGKHEKVSHIVIMGIGEPFDNFENVMNFIHIMKDQKGLSIGPRHITVSTSGLTDKIKQFTDLNLQVNLAISLHAPNNELRTKIMKINRALPIEKLMEAMDYYINKTNRRIMLEYILLKNENDHKEHAIELAALIGDRSRMIHVNLIPYNPVDEHSQYQRSKQEAIMTFYDTLKKQGVQCVIRVEHGTDIDAACGQLRSKQLAIQ